MHAWDGLVCLNSLSVGVSSVYAVGFMIFTTLTDLGTTLSVYVPKRPGCNIAIILLDYQNSVLGIYFKTILHTSRQAMSRNFHANN